MIVCPVCEHAQAAGADCDVCGKKLVHGPAGIPPVAPIDGLEVTRHGAVAAEAERLPDLEPTAYGAAGEAPPDPVALEPTRAAAVDVAVEPTPDVERIEDGLPDDARTEVPLFVTCRYCRTEAMPGERMCARCGMALPDFGGPGALPEALPRICSCGAPVRGSLCPACGARR